MEQGKMEKKKKEKKEMFINQTYQHREVFSSGTR